MNTKPPISVIHLLVFIRIQVCIILLALGANFTQLQARHIIGGDISYQCLGNGLYQFTMKIYRDCSNPFGDNFDVNAPIAVFKGNEAPYETVFVRTAPLMFPITTVPPDNENPCLILPPNVCVEQGIYNFNLTLPASDETYHIVYQRCCRNNTISNIIEPGGSGATYVMELSPLAQSLCNDSPVFNDFPPIVICAGEPLVFDHSATDADGDQLVYELCSPLLGAGVLGFLQPGDPTSCDGFRPNPPCPPPFDNVNFRLPNYSSLNPLGGTPPAIAIDPVTGIISGTPMILGQFVVGICVSEYRNGELLSVMRRDFQFNVASCEPTVVARVEADEELDHNEFIIEACGTTIDITNISFQQNFINNHFWEFDIGGQNVTLNSWHATVEVPSPGTYTGTLVLNPNSDCGDTAFLNLQVFPGVEADFNFDYDTCIAGPVLFTDLSTPRGGPITNWQWAFGDGSGDGIQNPAHLYETPGQIAAQLKVTDADGCEDISTQSFNYQPVPALIVIAPTAFTGCVPATIQFNNLSVPIDETYDIFWDFGDGGNSTDISPIHVFDEPGFFTISIEIISPIGCETDTIFNNLISMQPSPTAGFVYTPTDPSNVNPLVQFEDLSKEAVQWAWDFGTGITAFEQYPTYTFPDTGQFIVRQIVTHPLGCMDTLVQVVDVKPEIRFYLPNAFTPNHDNVNDSYLGVGFLAGAKNFHLSIWNRWGEQIFETNDPEEGWNGLLHNKGKMMPNGVYTVLVSFTGPRGKLHKEKGIATLIR